MHALLDSVVFLGLKSRVGGLFEQFEQDITIVLAMMFAKAFARAGSHFPLPRPMPVR